MITVKEACKIAKVRPSSIWYHISISKKLPAKLFKNKYYMDIEDLKKLYPRVDNGTKQHIKQNDPKIFFQEKIWIDPNERMRIDSNCNFGIGIGTGTITNKNKTPNELLFETLKKKFDENDFQACEEIVKVFKYL